MKETRYPGNFNPCMDEDLLIQSMETVTTKHMENKNEIPRSACMWKWVPAEKAIADSIAIIEQMGADTLLTDAQCLLQEAQRKIADYVDNVLPNSTDRRINPLINTYLEDVTLKGSPKTPLDKYFDNMLKTGSF